MHKLAYQQGQTIIHRLYPIAKFAWLLLGSILVFVIQNEYILWFLTLILLWILTSLKSDIWHVRGFKLTLITGVLLLVLYILFDKSGALLLDPGFKFLSITSGGLGLGLRVSGRFLAIVFMSYIFILTTDPNQLAYTLMEIGLPYRYGFMLVTALRLAPILEEEGKTIYRAQLVRGIRYDQRNLKKLFLIIQQFLTPLLISALRRADKLVFSMEGRGFGKYPTRTFRNQEKPTSLDWQVSIGLGLFFSVLLLISFGVLS